MGIDRTIQNQQLISNEYEYAAVKTITTSNFSVSEEAKVELNAGKSILMLDGTYIHPNALGFFEANIKPFNPCQSDLSRDNYLGNNEAKYNPIDDSSILVEETLQTDIVPNPSYISIYPNPANDEINIELTEGCHTIEIYDSFGRMMISQQVAESTGRQVVDVDVSKYPSGLYLVVVKNNYSRYYKRMVKN